MPQYGPVQIVPPGLLGMLNLKNVGRNPNTLDSNIQGGIDLTEWLMLQGQEYYHFEDTVPIAGRNTIFQGVSLIVPDNEWWYVWTHTASVTCLVGDSVVALQAVAQIPAALGNFAYVVQPETWNSAGAVGPYSISAGGTVRNFFPPGTSFGYGGGGIALAATRQLTVSLVITRLPF